MIRTHALQFQYPGGEVLEFADVDLPVGGTLLLQGPSGGGKSTWLALVAGLRRPTGGRLTVAGTDLTLLAPRALDAWRAAHLGFLPQRLHLSESLTVAQNLALVYLAAGLPRDDAAIGSALSALDVAHLAGRKPAQLSGGQAQRVALARAVLLRPQVLLADEPTANLDDTAAHVALTLLLDTARRCGASCVVATHDARVRTGFSWSQTRSLPSPVFNVQLSNVERTADRAPAAGEAVR